MSVSKMENLQCIICYRLVQRKKSRGQDIANKYESQKVSSCNVEMGNIQNCNALKMQLPVILLIRRLLRVPQNVCLELLQYHGNPCSWIYWCDACSALVSMAENFYNQINWLEQQLEMLRANIIRTMRLSTENDISKPGTRKRKNHGANRPSEIIRSCVLGERDSHTDSSLPLEEEEIEFPSDYEPGEESEIYSLDPAFTRESENHCNNEMRNNKDQKVVFLTDVEVGEDKVDIKLEENDDAWENKHNFDNSPSRNPLDVARKTFKIKRQTELSVSVPDSNKPCRNSLRPRTTRVIDDSISPVSDVDTWEESEASDWSDDEKSRNKNLKDSVVEQEKRRVKISVSSIKCDVCDRTFSRWRNLRIHFRNIHGQLPYNCKVCKIKLVNDTDIACHNEAYHSSGLKNRLDRQCMSKTMIKSAFSALTNLLKKYKIKMPDSPEVKEQLENQSHAYCKVCGRIFVLRSRLIIHCLVRHSLPFDDIFPLNGVPETNQTLNRGTIHEGGRSETVPNHEEEDFIPNDSKNNNIDINCIGRTEEIITSKTEVQCHVCNRSYLSHKHLKTHMYSCHKSNLIECQYCSKFRAINENEMEAHVKKDHNFKENENKYSCRACNNIYISEDFLLEHRRKDHGIKYDLQNYSKKTTDSSAEKLSQILSPYKKRVSNNTHLTNHHGDEGEERENGTLSNGNLKTSNDITKAEEVCSSPSSEKNEWVEEPFIIMDEKEENNITNEKACQVCNRSFSSPNLLRKHFLKYHRDAILECRLELCKYLAISKKHLGLHMILHNRNEDEHVRSFRKIDKGKKPLPKDLFCNKCQLQLKAPQSFKLHVLLKHPEDGRIMFPDHKPMTQCPFCSYASPRDSHVQVHIMRCHRNERPYPCNLCGKDFTTNFFLNVHRTSAHYEELGLQPYECKECDKKYSLPSSLRDHMKEKHSDVPKVYCHICGREFMSKRRLNDHMKRHNEQQLCELCGVSFKTKIGLKKHLCKKVHTDGKPFVCEQCHKQFKLPGLLKKHVRRSHGPDKKSYDCKLCGKTFSAKVDLTEHKKSNHKKKRKIRDEIIIS